MKKLSLILASLGAAGTLCAQSPTPTPAPSPNDIESLRQQVQALTATVKTLQQQLQDQQAALAKMNAGPATLPTNENGAATATATPAASAPPLFPTNDQSVVASAPEPSPLPANATGPAAAPLNQPFPTTDASVTTSSETISSSGAGAALTAPMTVAGSRAAGTYMNISFDGQFSLSPIRATRISISSKWATTIRSSAASTRAILELALDGAVDPYFEGFANIVLKLDNDNETEIEVEEAFLQTTDLPWGLQVKGGQFFAAFGRINPTHPHTWDFADDPLVHGRLLGSGRSARRRRAGVVDGAGPVVFAVSLRGAKRTRQYRLILSAIPGDERNLLRSPND